MAEFLTVALRSAAGAKSGSAGLRLRLLGDRLLGLLGCRILLGLLIALLGHVILRLLVALLRRGAIGNLLDRLGLLDPKQLLGIRMRPGRAILSRECCRKAYLRGAFLACGWISQPEKAYHFEFAAPDEEQAKTLQELIARWDVQARISARKSQQIVYVKKSEDVETLLGVLGASSALLTFENVRIMKSLRNDLNRQMICDDFNTDKTVRAAAQQLDDIAVIEKYLGLGKLPASLRQAAEARIASPDATLSQLGELMDPPAAKSAVNKRIRRLGELAQKLRDEHGL